MPSSSGPAIILIGGNMTVDDGTVLDSRQPIDGDPSSQVSHASLTTSMLWWITAASAVGPILDSAEGDAFALVLGNRSVVELRHDGTLRRTNLRSLLPGGTTNAEIIRTTSEPLPARFQPVPGAYSNGTVGIDTGEPGRRWRFFKGNEFFLRHVGSAIGPTVIVDTSRSLMDGTEITATQLDNLQYSRLFDHDVVLVLPHTHRAEALVNAYHDRRAGRWHGLLHNNDWTPESPPDPNRYTCPVPVQAEFAITGMSYGGSWRDPADLEAARALLQARFDLKIGIWDLARNPVLRRTLLQSSPTPKAPSQAAAVPDAAARRANKQVTSKIDEKAATLQALAEISAHLEPLHLKGWQDQRPGDLRLPLTREFPRWNGPEPLVWLRLTISKRRTEVTGFALLYNHPDVNIDDYVKAHLESLRDIAAPAEFTPNDAWPVLWREKGGWADDIGWSARASQLANRTEQWKQVFHELCVISLEVMDSTRPYQ